MANDQSGKKGQVGARHFILASLVDEDRLVPLLSDFADIAPAVNDYVLLGISTIISTFISVIVDAHLGKPSVPLTLRIGAGLGGGAAGSFGGMILSSVYNLDRIAPDVPWVAVLIGTLMAISFQKYLSDYSNE